MIFLDKKSKRIVSNSTELKTKGRGIVEDTTEYGEFVCSFDAWLPLEEQKKNAEFMEHLGD